MMSNAPETPIQRYPWWEATEDPGLAQGDLLLSVEIPIPKIRGEHASGHEEIKWKIELSLLNVIVMTQSCDIGHGKVGNIRVCRWSSLWDFVDAAERKNRAWGADMREKLRQGNLPGYHLLYKASCNGLEVDLGIVDFKQVYTLPLTVMERFLERRPQRLRLLPPYREHWAQAFARFFMRVGLPIDIPKEEIKHRPAKG